MLACNVKVLLSDMTLEIGPDTDYVSVSAGVRISARKLPIDGVVELAHDGGRAFVDRDREPVLLKEFRRDLRRQIVGRL